MRRLLATLVVAVAALTAAVPAPPVITIDGLAAAAKLTPAARSSLAPRVAAFNASLEKLVAWQQANPKATAQQRATGLREIHEALMKQHQSLMEGIDPAAHAACHAYIMEQLKAAGLDPSSEFMSHLHAKLKANHGHGGH